MKEISAEKPRPSAPLKRIVYVEDEDANWEVAELLLKKKFELTRARNAREACVAIPAIADLYAILMDIQLSGSDLDGIELTRLLRGTLPQEKRPSYALGLPVSGVPIIFMTAYGARYTEDDLIKVGGNMLVTKPVDFVKLSLGLASVSLKNVYRHLGTNTRP